MPGIVRSPFASLIGAEFIHNIDAAATDTMEAALAAQQANIERAVMFIMGTSVPMGRASGTGTNGDNGAAALCYPTRVRDLGRLEGKNWRTDNWYGTKLVADAQLALYDPRMEWGSGWGATSSGLDPYAPGGYRVRNNTDTSATAVRLVGSQAWNRARILHMPLDNGPASALQISAGGTLSSGVPSGETVLGANVSQSAGSVRFEMVERSTGLPAAVQALNVKRIASSTATVYLGGMEMWDADNLDLSIINGGQAGASSAMLASVSQAYNPLVCLPAIGPQIVGVDCLTNDILNSGTSYSTIEANLRAIIARAKKGHPSYRQGSGMAQRDASIILFTSNPVNTAGATQARQEAIADLCIEIGKATDCVVIDNFRLLGGSYTEALARGFMADSNHPSALGHTENAKLPTRLLLAAGAI